MYPLAFALPHPHSVPQDVVVRVRCRDRGKPVLLTAIDDFMQAAGYRLLRINLPRTRVNKGKRRKGREQSGPDPLTV